MNAPTESRSLGWISLDLNGYIASAKNSFESYLSSVEEKTDSGKLQESLLATGKCLEIFSASGLNTAEDLTKEVNDVLKGLVANSLSNKSDAYQVVIGGINQLLNYLSRLKRSGRENPTTVLQVINDLRAVSNKSLFLPLEQFEIKSLDYSNVMSSADIGEPDKGLANANKDLIQSLWRVIDSNLQAIVAKPDEQRQALLNIKKELICLDLQTIGLEKGSLVAEILMAIEGVVGGALRNGNRLPISARYTVKHVIDAIRNSVIDNNEEGQDWKQLSNELLYCLCVTSDSSESSAYLFAKYHLDDAIKIENKEALLHLGTPDAESIAIVIDGLSDDISVLQGGLQLCAESEGDLSNCGDLGAMAANLQYTLQIVQFYSLASDLEAVVEQLTHAQKKGSIENSRLEPVIGKLLEVDAALRRHKIGSGRDSSEISVIEQLQNVVREVEDSCQRCGDLDIESATKLISNEQIVEEMQSTLAFIPDALSQVAGAAKFIQNEQLTGVISAITQFFHSEITSPLSEQNVQAARGNCKQLSNAVQVLEKYLDALKESNHALVDNLLLQVGDLIGFSGLAIPPVHTEDSSAGEQAVQEGAKVVTLVEAADSSELQNAGVIEIQNTSSFIEVPLDADLDDEIVEIFLEEAEEVFDALNEQYELLLSDNSNESALAEIRRGYHTLKGSGRMAGAEDIGNAAWSVENLLNRIIDKTVMLDELRLGLIGEANQYLPVLIAYFTKRIQPFSPALESLIERSDLLANHASASIDLNTSLQLEEGKNSDSVPEGQVKSDTPDVLIAEPEVEINATFVNIEPSEDIALPGIEASCDISEESAIEPIETSVEDPGQVDASDTVLMNDPVEAAVSTDPVSEEEPVVSDSVEASISADFDNNSLDTTEQAFEEDSLLSVFMNEARQQLGILVGYCEKINQTGEYTLPDEAIERAFHTLSGGAAIAGLVGLAQLMGPAENLVRDIRRKSYIDSSLFQLINRAVVLLQSFIDDDVNDNSVLLELANQLEIAIDRVSVEQGVEANESISEISSHCSLLLDTSDFLKEWRVSSAHPDRYDAVVAELKQLAIDSAGEESIVGLCLALVDCYECFSGAGLHYQVYWALHRAHIDLVNMLDSLAAGQSVQESSTDILRQLIASENDQRSEQADRLTECSNSQSEEDKLDQEIVSIFLEESADLIEEVEGSVSNWLDNTEDHNYLESLLRPLHTLKGGARMAGLEMIGDLCHDFETMLQSLKNGDVKADRQFFKQLEQYFNDLTVQFSDITDSGSIEKGSQSTAKVGAENSCDNNKGEKRVAEAVRVSSDLLDRLVNLAGETSISRSLVEEQLTEFNHSIDEIDSTVERLKEQLRRLEIETEAQIAFRQERVEIEGLEEFDPLEMDRYSQFQQLSKSLVESASDLKDLKGTLRDKTRDVETLLLQQARINTELQEGLMQTRTVPLSRTIVPRLRKTIRQVSGELDKPVKFEVGTSDGELDKSVIERMVAPLEHVLRNAIDHGIETVEQRRDLGKPPAGVIRMNISREGSDVVLRISDDGKGIDVAAVKEKAIEKGLLSAGQDITDEDLAQIIFSPGFSTAESVTQISGRGVGMDVVKSEIQDLGGSVELQTVQGEGATFVFRLPFTLSMNRALLVSAGGESVAIPLDTIEGIVRVSPYELEEYYGDNALDFLYAGHKYDFRYLGSALNGCEPQYSSDMVGALPVLLVRAGEQLIAYQVDRLLGSREIVVKSLGPQFTELPGIIGATVLGDGSVVMIADLGALTTEAIESSVDGDDVIDDKNLTERERPLAMVVDDSVTVRKVTTRLLERQGMDVVTAKDGQDAMEKLEDLKPDFMLLDIEMPRLDGFEVVSRVRHDPRLVDLPIIMITSRTGEKHRERALALGANGFLGKPYQEQVLFSKIAEAVPVVASQYAAVE